MADCYNEDTGGLRGLTTPARNNYFYGKMLDVQHFTMEQRYFNQKRWLLNRLALGSGVVCGLQFIMANGRLALGPGVAIDQLGREIIVPAPVPIDPRRLTDECGKPIGEPTGQEVTICLAYHPCATELVPVLVGDCDTREGCAPSTIRESYAVLVHDGPAAPYEPACAIPDLFEPATSQSPPTMADVYAKIVTLVASGCADTGNETCVVLGQVTLPTGTAPLTDQNVRYAGRQVLLNNTMLFELILCLWERVEQCCAGTAPTSSPPPTVSPPPNPPPTPQPQPLLTVANVRIVNTGPDLKNSQPSVLKAMLNPPQTLSIKQAAGPNAIDVEFSNGQLDPDSIIADETFVVETPGGQIIPGQVVVLVGHIARWAMKPEQILPKGPYHVRLVGNGAGAIRSLMPGGQSLDGEPTQLPSGDGLEGGNFSFDLRVN